jgi:hypothetical protein
VTVWHDKPPVCARPRRRRRRRPGRCRPCLSLGFTLVEVVLACVIGSLILAAAWSWLFTSISAGAHEAGRLEAETSLAFVQRITSAELRRAVVFLASSPPGCSGQSVVFATAGSDGSKETISYVWNPSTRVLWRKAAGSHLASEVRAFQVEYFDGAGARVTPAAGDLSQSELVEVRRVRLTIALAGTGGELRAAWDVTPRAAR